MVQRITSLELDGTSLTPGTVTAVARRRVDEVRLAEAGREAMERSRRRIEELLEGDEAIYGVNTGFGHFADVRVPDDRLDELQLNLVRSHAVGTGEELPKEVVRALLLLRANVLARGRSGARPRVAEVLLRLLNADICPVVPRQGSVGASGDLAPAAHVAQVLIGEGEARVEGERLSGREALARIEEDPLRLRPKEGLALLNGTQLMCALGCIALVELEALCDVADAAGALVVEALGARTAPFEAAVADLRPHPGHARSARGIRAWLRDSELSDRAGGHVQDAYSIRCMPQIHGATRDLAAAVRRTLEIEVNAVTDNPVLVDAERVLSCGNFHGQPVAFGLDWLAMGATDLAAVSERRVNRLLDPKLSGLSAFLVSDGGLRSGYLMVQTLAAALVNEIRTLAVPASTDNVPTSADQEDHVSMGAWAGWQAYQAVRSCRRVLAIELMCACEAVERRGAEPVAPALRPLVRWVRARVPDLSDADRALGNEIEGLAAALGDAEEVVAPPGGVSE